MKIKLKSISMENFRGVHDKCINFGERTLIKGRNRSGKTTIINAFTYLLFDKDMNGDSITDVRPHDKNGIDVDHVEVSVTAVIDVDGKEITLQKKQVQKWKNDVLQGNDNLYYINEIPKKLKEYKEYISENISNEETLLFCICISSFFRLDNKKRRQKLLDLVGDVSNADVLASDEKYAGLESILSNGMIDELIKRQNDRIKKFEKEKDDIPARIDEVSKQKVDIDMAEWELAKADCTRKIVECDAKIKDAGKAVGDLMSEEMQLQFEMSGIMQTMNRDIYNKRSTLQLAIIQYENSEPEGKQDILDVQKRIDKNKAEIISLESKKPEINAKYKENQEKVFDETPYLFDESKWVFDENSTVCSMCGQTLPADKIEALKAEFEERRNLAIKISDDRLNSARDRFIKDKEGVKHDLLVNAEEIKKRISELTAENEDLQKQIADLQEQEKRATDRKAELEKQLSELPTEADYTQNAEYVKLKARHDEVVAEIEKLKSVDDKTSQYESKKAELQEELDKANEMLIKAQRNVEVDERISELTEQLRNIEQLKANEERTKYLLEEFNKVKMEMLTEKVNKYFEICQFKLFEQNVTNDGCKNICDIIVGGTNYERSLNGGDRLLANVDLLVGFQKMVGMSAPIFLDEAGVIDDDRLPHTSQQLILLIKSEDKELVVANG